MLHKDLQRNLTITQVIWTFEDKNGNKKNAQSAYNSHVAGTQKKKKTRKKWLTKIYKYNEVTTVKS